MGIESSINQRTHVIKVAKVATDTTVVITTVLADVWPKPTMRRDNRSAFAPVGMAAAIIATASGKPVIPAATAIPATTGGSMNSFTRIGKMAACGSLSRPKWGNEAPTQNRANGVAAEPRIERNACRPAGVGIVNSCHTRPSTIDIMIGLRSRPFAVFEVDPDRETAGAVSKV
jgi:hypothetical protein